MLLQVCYWIFYSLHSRVAHGFIVTLCKGIISDNVCPCGLFCFFRINFAILDLCISREVWESVCQFSHKYINISCISLGIKLTSQINLRKIDTFAILCLLIYECGTFFHFLGLFKFSQHCFVIFNIEFLHFFCYKLALHPVPLLNLLFVSNNLLADYWDISPYNYVTWK